MRGQGDSDDTDTAAGPSAAQPPEKARQGSNDTDLAAKTTGAVRGSDLPPDDILLGRGVPMQRHPGNIRMHHLINSYRPLYRKATRTDKASMIQEVLQKLKQGGVRFRKREDHEDLWAEVSDQVAYDKISHALRGRGSERRAPPLDSVTVLAGGVPTTTNRPLEEGKGESSQDVTAEGNPIVAEIRSRGRSHGPLPNFSEGSSQIALGSGSADATNAIALARLIDTGAARARPYRPYVSLPTQRNESLPPSLSAYAISLGFSPDFIAPPVESRLSTNPDRRNETLPSLASTAGNPVDRTILQQLLLQQLHGLQRQQQQILTPAVEIMMERLRGTTSGSGTQSRQPSSVSNTASMTSGTSALLDTLRGNASTDLQLNNTLLQSLLQQSRPRDSALVEAMTRQITSHNISAVLPQSALLPGGRVYPGLSLALGQNLDHSQQQLLLQNSLGLRRRENLLASLNDPAANRAIPNEIMLALLSRQNNPQPPSHQEQRDNQS